eukprot:scaffold25790_cov59-Phaeocystis_antarctica.AAC.6
MALVPHAGVRAHMHAATEQPCRAGAVCTAFDVLARRHLLRTHCTRKYGLPAPTSKPRQGKARQGKATLGLDYIHTVAGRLLRVAGLARWRLDLRAGSRAVHRRHVGVHCATGRARATPPGVVG